MCPDLKKSVVRSYRASVIGNIKSHLMGMQGFASMAREIIQNADDSGAQTIKFDIREDNLAVWNNAELSNCEVIDECPWKTQGNPYSGTKKACDFHAISEVGSSNKFTEKGLIGRFGIGFVSVSVFKSIKESISSMVKGNGIKSVLCRLLGVFFAK